MSYGLKFWIKSEVMAVSNGPFLAHRPTKQLATKQTLKKLNQHYLVILKTLRMPIQ